MQAVRVLAAVLLGLALFVQSSAYAVAQPKPPEPVASPCAEMHAQETRSAPGGPDQGCCEHMQLHCLVGMNCLSPLLSGGDAPSIGTPAAAEAVYGTSVIAAPSSHTGGPEPPPPQIA
jgi:hypothetical protein